MSLERCKRCGKLVVEYMTGGKGCACREFLVADSEWDLDVNSPHWEDANERSNMRGIYKPIEWYASTPQEAAISYTEESDDEHVALREPRLVGVYDPLEDKQYTFRVVAEAIVDYEVSEVINESDARAKKLWDVWKIIDPD